MNTHDGTPGNEYYAPESLMKFLKDDEQTMQEIRPDQKVPTSAIDDIDNDDEADQIDHLQQKGIYPDLNNDDYSTIN